VAPQKPLRADEPVIQGSELDSARDDGVGKANHPRNRDLRVLGATSQFGRSSLLVEDVGELASGVEIDAGVESVLIGLAAHVKPPW
jgi:hypothetical protein